MKNAVILHQWDFIQWDFLFGTEGKIFSQKEFFIHYSQIYIWYSLKKIQSFIFSSSQSENPHGLGQYSFMEKPTHEQLLQNIPAQWPILLITQKDTPNLDFLDQSRIQKIIIDDNDFLAQVEPEWKNLRNNIENISPSIIVLYLGIARIIIASRLLGYERDFIDISWFEKSQLPISHEKTIRKYLKKNLLKLRLYGIAITLFQILWKVFKKK